VTGTKRALLSTSPERAFLVGVDLYGKNHMLPIQDSISELSQLSKTAGLVVVGELIQKLNKPNVETYIGPGKAAELKSLAEETRADVVIFDDELSPRHLRELEKTLGGNIRVLDRTALILDIFAQHARTNDGKLQVELAQYEYYLPRLTRAWTHLERQAGGGGGRSGSVGGVGLRGPGETQLEVDRRKIRHRITTLKVQIEKFRSHRMRYRLKRKMNRVPIVVIIGYTNAGKSTLLNKIAGANVQVADQLFATLDPTTRRVDLPDGFSALFTDTVGFIQKLPTTLIAAFHATLEEIAEADLLLHVLDISHPNALNHFKIVNETLKTIDASEIPVVTALNKIDRLSHSQSAIEIIKNYEKSVAISARDNIGLTDLLELIKRELFESYQLINVRIPYDEGGLISLFHEVGVVQQIVHERGAVTMNGRLPGRYIAQFSRWRQNGKMLTSPISNQDE
jgi:GTP-binding protein HflX